MKAHDVFALVFAAALCPGPSTAPASAQESAPPAARVDGTLKAEQGSWFPLPYERPASEGAAVWPGASGADGPGAGEDASPWDVFHAGRQALQFTVGPYYSTRLMGAHHLMLNLYDPNPTLNFLPVNVRLGTMLTTPERDGSFFSGNFEIIGEFLTAPAFKGYAHIAVGPDVMLRYNFVPGECRLIPYIQAAVGVVYTDGYKDRIQDTLGSEGEFSLQAQVGCHYLLNEHWSIEVEAGYLHISNADLGDRNGGYNSFGCAIGVTFRFPTAGW